MTNQITELQVRIDELKAELQKLKLEAEPVEVEDFSFQTLTGQVKLSELFGDKTDLLVIHNMGPTCSYCTAWADGFEGQRNYYEDRAAIAICNGESPENQAKFASTRRWGFRMISDSTKAFTTAMGYWSEENGWYPGASGFKLENGKIYRTGTAIFGPGDDFCPIWPMFELIGGPKGWEPDYQLTK